MENLQNSTEPSPQHDIEIFQEAVNTGRNVRLTSSELASLWVSWMESSIKERIVKYFLKIADDPELKQLLEYTLKIAHKHLRIISEIYTREKHPIPIGFTDEDVNPDAPRLFSDSFILSFLEDLARTRLDGYSTALQMCTRQDVRVFFTECVADPAEIYNRAVSIMLSKGLAVRPPHIDVPEKIDFVESQSYLAGYFGKKRPLNSIEISHIFAGLQKNWLREAMFAAFSQVAGSDQVKQYMEWGKEIAGKHIEIFSSLLSKNNLPVTMSWDTGVMKSKIAPFSDRLMMQHIRVSNVVLIAAYSKAIPVLRHDLMAGFLRLVPEIVSFLERGVDILIESGWLEEPPQAQETVH